MDFMNARYTRYLCKKVNLEARWLVGFWLAVV